MATSHHSIWLGFDPREAAAFAVAKHSARRHLTTPLQVQGIVLDEMRRAGLYTRPTRIAGGLLWDDISGAAMSTEFAISRFLTPHLAGYKGWALFMDSDVLVRGNLARLFDQADSSKAVQVVQHDFRPTERYKMDRQLQQPYPRKNWSSVMLFNCGHERHQQLFEMVNTVPGRDLHGFRWLRDSDIGALDVRWNWLAGHSEPVADPQVVHFTDGFPQMEGYQDAPYANEWRAELALLGLALVLGGANTLQADLAAARALLGRRAYTVVATNHAGRDWTGPLPHWVTFHVELLPLWMEARRKAGQPDAGQLWGVRRFPIPPHDLPVRRVENWGGSSGLVAVTVSIEIGLSHALLCGVPMDMHAAHYDDARPWSDAGNYRRKWIQHKPAMANVRSMGGWTADLLGTPDAAWIEEATCEKKPPLAFSAA